MAEQALTFMSGDLKLEGKIHLPGAGGVKLPGAVICHPHPLYGGNMHNNVVIAVSRALAEKGICALRFNFRGTGASEGVFDDGEGEQNDLFAALKILAERPEVDPVRLGVTGYSFGGLVSLVAVKKTAQVRALAAVSPVVNPGLMEGLSLPAFFICGSKDHVVSTELLVQEAEKISPPGKVEIVRGVDHFWCGFEKELAENVAAFLCEAL